MIVKQGETPLAFIERAERRGATDETIDHVLNQHFGITQNGEIKELKLKSAVFWGNFYRERAQAIFDMGGSRYAAVKFIERKNGQYGQKPLSPEDIATLVDEVGNWLR